MIKPEEYISQNVEGIKVYHDRDLQVKKPLVIDLNKFLGISSLVINGWTVV